ARTPTLRRRLDEVEHQMAGIRASLLEHYGRWRRSLEDVENLWALAAWRSATPDASAETSTSKEPTEEAASLAAWRATRLGVPRANRLELLPVIGELLRQRCLNGHEPSDAIVARARCGVLELSLLRGAQALSEVRGQPLEKRGDAGLELLTV